MEAAPAGLAGGRGGRPDRLGPALLRGDGLSGPGYDGDYDGVDVPYQPVQRGHRHPPRRLSAWAWGHALEHASAGDQPPLARMLMTTAVQAAMDANWRVAIIDAATATEAALTAGLAALSPTLLQQVQEAKSIDDARQALELASDSGMPLPPGIGRPDRLPERRPYTRAMVVTRDQVKAAIRRHGQ